jgi:hypothetical protein
LKDYQELRREPESRAFAGRRKRFMRAAGGTSAPR